MANNKITGTSAGIRSHYVCTKKDPRKTPLNQCVSLGDLMATITKCKHLYELDNNNNIKK